MILPITFIFIYYYCVQCDFYTFVVYNNFVNKMGGCAGCMGPSRRDENYRVNRLTENAVIKSRVSTA